MAIHNPRGDGYGRLTASTVHVILAPSQGGLFFLDMDVEALAWDTVSAALRGLSPAVLSDASHLVLRSPALRWQDSDDLIIELGAGWPTGVEDLASVLESDIAGHGLPLVTVGAVELPLAAAPKTSTTVDPQVLARCRAVELRALLLSGNAIWKPTKYHYRLPSGHHTGLFIRIADAFRDRRAPQALATWLYGCLTANTAVVVDSSTLMPIVQQLDHALRLAAAMNSALPTRGLSNISALDEYPRTRFEYLQRFASFGDLDVLALLSVSSTGRTYRMLQDTLNETSGDEWRAECLVDRGGYGASALPPPSAREHQAPWLALGEEAPFDVQAASCPYCQRVGSARVVDIDPNSFAAMVLPHPTRIMPDIHDARRNASIFEAYQGCNSGEAGTLGSGPESGVRLTAAEDVAAEGSPTLRPDSRPVKFGPATLLHSPEATRLLVERRVGELSDLPNGDRSRNEILGALDAVREGSPTVAICARAQLTSLQGSSGESSPATERVLSLAQAVCPSVQKVITDDDLNADVSVLVGHTSVLITSLGLQSGVTLQQLVVTVQSAYGSLKQTPEMHGVVLHAHPSDRQSWRAVRNTFRGPSGTARLLALWLTYLPRASPFADEFRVLNQVQDAWLDDASYGADTLWAQRTAWLSAQADEVAAPASPLWSSKKEQLRLTSFYGNLDDRHTLVAVGSAMHAALLRQVDEEVPEWVRFDLPNAFRSYFDGIIHASILRWTDPARAWWGADDNESEAVIAELHGRFEQDWRFLLPELLLAAAQGKVPRVGVDLLLAQAKAQLDGGDWPADVLSFVELGHILAENMVP